MKYFMVLLSALFLAHTDSLAIEIEVRLFSGSHLTKVAVNVQKGDYYLIACNKEMETLDTIGDFYEEDDRILWVNGKGDFVHVRHGERDLGVYPTVVLSSMNLEKTFIVAGNQRERIYEGDLRFRIYKGELQVVNEVDLEKYVAGVVESEAGHRGEFEFFKAQAVLARTFALKNWDKHKREGYNLKDDVSSQVYHSMCYLQNCNMIRRAAYETRDTILVDMDCDLVLSAFHANSGGQTANSEEAWIEPIEYLRSREDPFSVGQPGYEWKKTVSHGEFFSYFADRLGTRADDPFLRKKLLNLRQEERLSHFEFKDKKVPLKDVRNRFRLRSTFFDVHLDGDNILLTGRGYGHGVGMSQDGAINMSAMGFCYDEILYYYFQHVELENLHNVREGDCPWRE